MFKSMRWSFWTLVMTCSILFFAACEKDQAVLDSANSDAQTQNFVRTIQSSANSSTEGEDSTDYGIDCFEFVFPIEVSIPGSDVTSVDSEEAFFDLLDQWFEDNEGEEDIEGYPTFVFPIQVILDDSTSQSIQNEEELCELHEECFEGEYEDWGDEDWGDEEWEDWDEGDYEDEMCFTFQFPVNVVLPDGTVSVADSEEAVEDIFYDWFEANEDEVEETYPTFEYPLTVVILEDSTTQVINSDEELDELFEECFDHFFEDCFEVNYPVDVALPDGTVLNAADEDGFYEIIDTWFEGIDEDDEIENFPSYVYPIEVTLEDGTVESVENEEALEALYEDCYEEECPVDGAALNTGGDEQVATKTVLKRKTSKVERK
ncbi:MAG: hypothetical protein AB8B69_24295 [Chitinophagales bacterium]